MRFYQTLFPDWYIRAEEKSDDFDWMHFGNRQFYMSLYERRDTANPIPLETGNIDHVGFVIEDGEKMIAVLERHGIEYFVEDAPETKYRIYIQDPDGTVLELIKYREDYGHR